MGKKYFGIRQMDTNIMIHSFSEAADLAELINRAKYAKRISNGSTGATPVNFHPRIGTCASDLTAGKSMQSTGIENLWRCYGDLYNQVGTIANARRALQPLFLRKLGVF